MLYLCFAGGQVEPHRVVEGNAEIIYNKQYCLQCKENILHAVYVWVLCSIGVKFPQN